MTGIVCINKPEGYTSFDVVARVRGITREKKCGHTGTLDPMATGVLPIALGGATRFCDLLPTQDKAYEATVQLGVTTDTLDRTGTVLSTAPASITAPQFEKALQSFTGEILQVPPMYSAISKDGVRLYTLARQGIAVEREARPVTIYDARLLCVNLAQQQFTFAVSCSAGTYIRSLAQDIGQMLGCGAMLTGLTRTQANGFALADCVTIEQLQAAKDDETLPSLLLPVAQALSAYPAVTVTPAQATRFANGGALDLERLRAVQKAGIYRVFAPDNRFLGLGETRDSTLAIKKLFVAR